jgi:hypothetical protein
VEDDLFVKLYFYWKLIIIIFAVCFDIQTDYKLLIILGCLWGFMLPTLNDELRSITFSCQNQYIDYKNKKKTLPFSFKSQHPQIFTIFK